jgi:putative endonuclease
MTRKQIVGKWGEDLAAVYLQEQGYEIIARNLRTPYGEIDIIARKLGRLVFIEVKARSSSSFGLPEVSVTPRKIHHLMDSIQFFFQAHPDDECEWRIDVIAIQGSPGSASPEIVHFENAIS